MRRAGAGGLATARDVVGAAERRARAGPLLGERLTSFTSGGGPGVMAAGAVCRGPEAGGAGSRGRGAGRASRQGPRAPAAVPRAGERYAAAGGGSRRTVRSRYDLPTPRGGVFEGDIRAIRLPRSGAAARTGARVKAGG